MKPETSFYERDSSPNPGCRQLSGWELGDAMMLVRAGLRHIPRRNGALGST